MITRIMTVLGLTIAFLLAPQVLPPVGRLMGVIARNPHLILTASEITVFAVLVFFVALVASAVAANGCRTVPSRWAAS